MNEIREEECEYLRTALPSRLNQLTEILSAASIPPESAWCSELAGKLIQSVVRTGRDLLTAMDCPDALPLAAWNARNMVELAVWTRYCGQSERNARRFYEDALRDMKGIVISLAQLHKLVGVKYQHEQSSHELLDQLARAKLGLKSLDAEYAAVSAAAKKASMSEWYLPTNRFLSKFAHPTAVLIIGILHQAELLPGMQSGCLAHGTQAARFCEGDLQRFVHALLSPAALNQ